MANNVCDWLPYRRNNTYYRTLHALRPEDWSGTALTNKADELGRFVEIAANGRSTWLPVNNSNAGELIAEFMLRPGQYGTCAAFCFNSFIEARIDVAAGLLRLYWGGVEKATGALPATMWTSNVAYSDAWLRIRFDIGASPYKVFGRVWSINEVEPATWTASFTQTGIMPAVVSDPNGLGNTGIANVSACRWFGYSDAWNPTPPAHMLDRGYFDKWFARAGSTAAPRVLAAEIFVPGWDGANVNAYTTAVLRVATLGYDGGAAWPFTNQVYLEGLRGWPTFARKLPDDVFGRQDYTIGDLLIENPNGVRDDWLRARMTNEVVTLRYGDPSWPWYDLRTVFTGTIMDVTEDTGLIRLKLRDVAGRYDRAVHRSTLPASVGANGGKPTPIAAGRVFNVPALLVDAATMTYQVAEGNLIALDAVRDKGVTLTASALKIIAFDTVGETAQFAAAHLLALNDAVALAGRLPSPLAAGTYYVAAIPAADKVRFSATPGGAVIDITQSDVGNTSTVVWPSTDTIRTAAAHGRSAGNILRALPLVGGLPGGLLENTDYYVIATGLTANEMKLSLTNGGAAVDLTGNTIVIWAVHSIADTLETETDHNLAVNDLVRLAGTVPTNTATLTDYYVKTVPSSRLITLSLTLGGATVDVQGTVAGVSVTAVNAATDEITLSSGTAFAVGSNIDFDATPPAPLVVGTAYWVQAKPSANVIKVAAFPGGPAIDLTSTTTGSAVRCYVTGGVIEKPVSNFRLTSYAGTASVDQVIPDLVNGKFRLKSPPVGQVTVDAQGQQFNGASALTGYHALGVLIGQRDPLVSVDSDHVLGLQREVGLWLGETRNLLDLFDLLARSTACVYGTNRVGTLSFWPSGNAFSYTPVGEIVLDDCFADGPLTLIAKRMPVQYNDGVRVAYKTNYTVQRESDLAGSVSAADRATYGAEATIKVMNAGFTPAASLDDGMKGQRRTLPLIETCLTTDTNAQWAGQSNLIDSPKQLGVLTVTVRWAKLDQFRLGQPTLVKIGRYGIDPAVGQAMVVIGIEEDLRLQQTKLTLLAELAGFYPVTT